MCLVLQSFVVTRYNCSQTPHEFALSEKPVPLHQKMISTVLSEEKKKAYFG